MNFHILWRKFRNFDHLEAGEKMLKFCKREGIDDTYDKFLLYLVF